LSLELLPASLEASISVDDDIDAAWTKSLSTGERGLATVVDAACVCAVAATETTKALAQSAPITDIFCSLFLSFLPD
jgi:hypothetical protein